MGLFDKLKKNFRSEKDKINQSHLRHFVIIAMATGKVTDEDYQFIENMGYELGLSKAMIFEVFNHPAKIESYSPGRAYEIGKCMQQYIHFANKKASMTPKVKKTLEKILISMTYMIQDRSNVVLDEIIKIVSSEENKLDLPINIKLEHLIRNEMSNRFFDDLT